MKTHFKQQTKRNGKLSKRENKYLASSGKRKLRQGLGMCSPTPQNTTAIHS